MNTEVFSMINIVNVFYFDIVELECYENVGTFQVYKDAFEGLSKMKQVVLSYCWEQ